MCAQLFHRCFLALIFVFSTLAQAQVVCDKYVSPTGSAASAGTSANPWSLTYALAGAGGQAAPGKTICLRGGKYPVMNLSLSASGTPSSPLIFRNVPGERPVFDATGLNGIMLTVNASYVWLWGLEFTDSAISPNESNGLSISTGTGVKVINSVFHDLGATGVSPWTENTGFELYGNYSFFNGRNVTHRGYGMYTQNATGEKLYEDNFFFWNFGGYNIHAYGQAGALNNMTYRGNVSMDGIMMIGGTETMAENLVWEENFNYNTGGTAFSTLVYIGYAAGVKNAIIRDNYFVSGTVWWAYANQIQTMTGNWFRGTIYYHYNTPSGINPVANETIQATFPSNNYIFGTWPQDPPKYSGLRTFVRKNRYESGRANVVVYNFDGVNSVTLDLSGIGLQIGQEFEIRDAQNFFGPPVVKGIYSTALVQVPLNGSLVAAPLSIPAGSASEITSITHASKEFNFFTVLPLSRSDVPAAPSALRVVPN